MRRGTWEELSRHYTTYEKVFLALFLTCIPHRYISLIQFNDNIGVQQHHQYLRQACRLIASIDIVLFRPEPKVSQKPFVDPRLDGCAEACNSKANTSTVLPTRLLGNVIDTFFWEGVIISLYTWLVNSLPYVFLLAEADTAFLMDVRMIEKHGL